MPLDKVVGSHSKSPGTFLVLTPKHSDPSSLKPASEASPVPCLKEPFKYDTTFEGEGYVFSFRGRGVLVFGLRDQMQPSANS